MCYHLRCFTEEAHLITGEGMSGQTLGCDPNHLTGRQEPDLLAASRTRLDRRTRLRGAFQP